MIVIFYILGMLGWLLLAKYVLIPYMNMPYEEAIFATLLWPLGLLAALIVLIITGLEHIYKKL